MTIGDIATGNNGRIFFAADSKLYEFVYEVFLLLFVAFDLFSITRDGSVIVKNAGLSIFQQILSPHLYRLWDQEEVSCSNFIFKRYV